MKKLFGRAAGGQPIAAKKDGAGPFTNKTVQVGPHTVLVEHVLGLGGYGEIYRAVDISSGQRFGLKHLRLDQENIGEVQREAKTMAKLRGHPNILRLHAVAFAGPRGAETDGFFLLDYCPGTLLDLMGRHKYSLENHTIIHIFASVCHAVAAMHHQKPPLAHRDLKAENVLMLPDGTWVVCDYGSACSRAQVYDTPAEIAAEEEVISKHTTPAYRPPEMWDLQLMRARIDTAVDIWALGVLLYVLCFGRLPFAGDSKLQIINGRYDLPRSGHTRPQQLLDLIQSLLQVEPVRRPSIDELLAQLDAIARTVMGRSILQQQPAAAAAPAAAAPAAAPAAPAAASAAVRSVGSTASGGALHAEGSFSGLAAAAATAGAQDRQQQHPQQQRQVSGEERAAQQQAFLRDQQLRQYQQQQEQHMAQQHHAQQEQLQQLQHQAATQAGSSSGGGGGTFWSKADATGPTADARTAAAGSGHDKGAAANGTAGAAVATTARPEQPPPSDWAHFSSPEQSPSGSVRQRPHMPISSSPVAAAPHVVPAAAAAAAATSHRRGPSGGSNNSTSSSSSSKRAAPPPPGSTIGPKLSAAAQGLRAHALAVPASPLDSPTRRSSADSPPGSSAAGVAEAAGGSSLPNPFAAERSSSGGLGMRWQPQSSSQPPPQQEQQQQHAAALEEPGEAKVSQLLDIQARAAALAAAREPARGQHTVSSTGSSVDSPVAAAGRQQQHHQPAVSADGKRESLLERQPRPYSSSSSGSPARSAEPLHARARGVGSVLAAGSSFGQRSSATGQQQQQQQPLQQHPPSRANSNINSAAHAVPAAMQGDSAVTDAAGLAAVLAELQQLRRDVHVLSEENQAFVFRIKQLEEYTMQQQTSMREMQQQMEQLLARVVPSGSSGQPDLRFSSDGWGNLEQQSLRRVGV